MRVIPNMMEGDMESFSSARTPCDAVLVAKMPSQKIYVMASLVIQKHPEEKPFATLRSLSPGR